MPGRCFRPMVGALFFGPVQRGLIELFEKSTSGGTNEELVLPEGTLRAIHSTAVNQIPTDWSRDGRYIIYSASQASGSYLWLFPVAGDRKPMPFLRSPFYKSHANFSPDGRFVAYSSNETGRV